MTLADALGLSGAKALARSLRGERLTVISLDEGVARAVEEAGHTSLFLRIENGRLTHDQGQVDALCLSGIPEDTGLLRECARAVKPGGQVLVATGMAGARRERHLVMALLLHAGLIDLRQRWSRGIVLSSGTIRT